MTAPVVYFIDDSATMREVIKIAFRRENIEVVACHDGESALTQMSQQKPDVVITDVIMPGKDGYEVCQNIKQNPSFTNTPVVLMSGVVNRQVAEKAFAVKADELIRKPFQPGDLIGRVKHLLSRNSSGNGSLSAAPVIQPASTPPPNVPPVVPQIQVQAASPNAAATLSSIFSAPPRANGNGTGQRPGAGSAPAAVAVAPAVSTGAPPSRIATSGAEAAKLKIEILRLEHLVKKLQSELQAEREYGRALEEHIKTLQESE